MRGEMPLDTGIGRDRRLAYAFAGLVTALVSLAVYLFLLPVLVRPARAITSPAEWVLPPGALVVAAIFATVGLVIVGAPVVLFAPPRFLNCLPWWLVPLAGALLGIAAMAADAVLIDRDPFSLTFARSLWNGLPLLIPLPAAAGAAGFSIYCWLLRRGAAATN